MRTTNNPPTIENTLTDEFLIVNDFESSNSKEIYVELDIHEPINYTISCEITILKAGTYGFIDDVRNIACVY